MKAARSLSDRRRRPHLGRVDPGAPTGDVTGWAGNRLIDTIVGCGIALVATYLLWPRDREAEATETVPVAAAT